MKDAEVLLGVDILVADVDSSAKGAQEVTANALGLTIPPEVLYRADRVIC